MFEKVYPDLMKRTEILKKSRRGKSDLDWMNKSSTFQRESKNPDVKDATNPNAVKKKKVNGFPSKKIHKNIIIFTKRESKVYVIVPILIIKYWRNVQKVKYSSSLLLSFSGALNSEVAVTSLSS